MSWSYSRTLKGKEILAEVDGWFDREIASPWHNEMSRLVLEAQKSFVRLFASLHVHKLVQISAWGHHNADHQGNHGVTLQVSSVQPVETADPAGPILTDADFPALSAVDHITANTGAHSPVVEYGVTTPITPSEPQTDLTPEEAAAFAEAASETEPTTAEGAES